MEIWNIPKEEWSQPKETGAIFNQILESSIYLFKTIYWLSTMCPELDLAEGQRRQGGAPIRGLTTQEDRDQWYTKGKDEHTLLSTIREEALTRMQVNVGYQPALWKMSNVSFQYYHYI